MPASADSRGWICGQAGLACMKDKDEFSLGTDLKDVIFAAKSPGLCSDLPVSPRGNATMICNAQQNFPFPAVEVQDPVGKLSSNTDVAYGKPPLRVNRPDATADIDLDIGSLDGGHNATIFPGDVLNIRSRYHPMTRLGGSGGFMGHVLLAVSEARPVRPRSNVGQEFQEFFADDRTGDTPSLYSVSIVECARERPGISQSVLVLHINSEGTIRVVGEDDGELVRYDEPEELLIWQSPAQFRSKEHFNRDVMHQVLRDMRAHQHSWSWSTAIRSFLWSRSAAPTTMKEIQTSWRAEPICTSVIVVFWQQYLQRIAQIEHEDPLQWILTNIPLKSDRVLPGELLQCLMSHGWTLWQHQHSGEEVFLRAHTIGKPQSL